LFHFDLATLNLSGAKRQSDWEESSPFALEGLTNFALEALTNFALEALTSSALEALNHRVRLEG
jgi:hypothetical protein